MQDEAYQREYDEALAKLEAGASIDEITQPRNPDGTFAKEEEKPIEQAAEPVAEAKPEEKQAEPEKQPDPVEELRIKLEKAEKALKDTQAWGTKNAQRLAEIERECERQAREAAKPEILQQQPELEEAIRFVTHDPQQEQAEAIARQQQQFQQIVEAVHPGIFTLPDNDELVEALVARKAASTEDWNDPLVMIREISAEKLAPTERQLAKRFEAEKAKAAQKSAMSVPGAGASSVNTQPNDPQKEAADRYQSMSSADFEKERRRVLGY